MTHFCWCCCVVSNLQLKSKKLRHANRMFRHTYIEPVPEQPTNENFAQRSFAQEVAHQMTHRIFAVHYLHAQCSCVPSV